MSEVLKICRKAIVVINRGHIVFMIACKSSSYCFCEIWTLCASWITYDRLYYVPCLACWALFGSLVPAMCNRTSCAQVHELPQSHCGDNREGTLFSCMVLSKTWQTKLLERSKNTLCIAFLILILYIYIFKWVIRNKEMSFVLTSCQ